MAIFKNGFIASMVTSRIVSGDEEVTDYIELVQQQRGSKYPTCRV
ncbi:hypothetical protein [Exiguobacterium sp. s140]|nr:hypothetical protein [Exiguobacterium sp. s140]